MNKLAFLTCSKEHAYLYSFCFKPVADFVDHLKILLTGKIGTVSPRPEEDIYKKKYEQFQQNYWSSQGEWIKNKNELLEESINLFIRKEEPWFCPKWKHKTLPMLEYT